MQEIYLVSDQCRVLHLPDVIQTAHAEISKGSGDMWAWNPVVSFKEPLIKGGRNYYTLLQIEEHCGKWGDTSSG